MKMPFHFYFVNMLLRVCDYDLNKEDNKDEIRNISYLMCN